MASQENGRLPDWNQVQAEFDSTYNNPLGSTPTTSSSPAIRDSLENQKFGPCLYITLVSIVSIILVALFFSPAISLFLFIGLLPCILIFIIIYIAFRSRINLELSFHVLWSGICSVIPVFVLETGFSILLIFILYSIGVIKIDQNTTSSEEIIKSIELQLQQLNVGWNLVYIFCQSFFIAALMEEITKALLALKVSSGSGPFSSCLKTEQDDADNLFYHSNYHPLPPMVYSAISALGFATIENLGYILTFLLKIVSQSSLVFHYGTMFVIGRIFLALPLHTLTGCLIGLRIVQYKIRIQTQQLTDVPIFIETGKQDTSGNSIWKKLWINTKFFVYIIYQPVLIHGLYDFVLMLDIHFVFSLVVCISLIAGLFFMVFRTYKTLLVEWNNLGSFELSSIIVQSDSEGSDLEIANQPHEQIV